MRTLTLNHQTIFTAPSPYLLHRVQNRPNHSYASSLYLFWSPCRSPRALGRSDLEPVLGFAGDFFHAAHTAGAGGLSSFSLEAPVICRGWPLEWLERRENFQLGVKGVWNENAPLGGGLEQGIDETHIDGFWRRDSHKRSRYVFEYGGSDDLCKSTRNN